MGREGLARSALALGVLSVAACNVAIAGGVVAAVGGTGYLVSQCYDHLKVRVSDAQTGERICDADVAVSEGGSERAMRSCYYASLTEGRWAVTARREGYVPASAELDIAERDGACPHYTHSMELTLWPVGASRPDAKQLVPAKAAAPSAEPAPPAPPEAAAPAPPSDTAAPPVPTRAFDTVSAGDAGAPR